jgi:hypothetical protein
LKEQARQKLDIFSFFKKLCFISHLLISHLLISHLLATHLWYSKPSVLKEEGFKKKNRSILSPISHLSPVQKTEGFLKGARRCEKGEAQDVKKASKKRTEGF